MMAVTVSNPLSSPIAMRITHGWDEAGFSRTADLEALVPIVSQVHKSNENSCLDTPSHSHIYQPIFARQLVTIWQSLLVLSNHFSQQSLFKISQLQFLVMRVAMSLCGTLVIRVKIAVWNVKKTKRHRWCMCLLATLTQSHKNVCSYPN